MIQNEFHIQQAEKYKMLDSMLSFLIFEREDKKLYECLVCFYRCKVLQKDIQETGNIGCPWRTELSTLNTRAILQVMHKDYKSFVSSEFVLKYSNLKNLPAVWETWVQSLGLGEDLLEKGKATHSSILAWRIPWTLIVHGVAKTWIQLNDFHSLTVTYSK